MVRFVFNLVQKVGFGGVSGCIHFRFLWTIGKVLVKKVKYLLIGQFLFGLGTDLSPYKLESDNSELVANGFVTRVAQYLKHKL
ncbi:hypothetical protein ACFQU5_05715 [Ureibacillus sp. GCM10028918]